MAGAHGYDPDISEMHSIIIAHGPSIRRNSQSFTNPAKALHPANNLDIYPLICRLLKIACLPGHEGSEHLAQHILVD